MLRKTSILRLFVFLLSIVIGAACFGADQTKFFDLTQALNERVDQRIRMSLKAPKSKFTPFEQIRLGRCGGFIHGYLPVHNCYQFGLCMASIPKYRWLSPLNIPSAFIEHTSLRILVLEPAGRVAPKWAGILMNSLWDDCVIRSETETTEGYAMRIISLLLTESLDEDLHGESFESDSAEAEIKLYKQDCGFIPALVFEYKSDEWLLIEIDTEHQRAVLQSKDRWGCCSFDKFSSEAFLAYAKSIQALCFTAPAE